MRGKDRAFCRERRSIVVPVDRGRRRGPLAERGRFHTDRSPRREPLEDRAHHDGGRLERRGPRRLRYRPHQHAPRARHHDGQDQLGGRIRVRTLAPDDGFGPFVLGEGLRRPKLVLQIVLERAGFDLHHFHRGVDDLAAQATEQGPGFGGVDAEDCSVVRPVVAVGERGLREEEDRCHRPEPGSRRWPDPASAKHSTWPHLTPRRERHHGAGALTFPTCSTAGGLAWNGAKARGEAFVRSWYHRRQPEGERASLPREEHVLPVLAPFVVAGLQAAAR